MGAAEEYVQAACERLQELCRTQRTVLRQAGELMAKAILSDRLIYVFGAGGHTSLAMGEMFFRVGGLANIQPCIESGLNAFAPAHVFLQCERTPSLGAQVLARYQPQSGDLLLVIHTIGVNASCIDAALEAKHRGMKVIGVASRFWQNETPPDSPLRHRGGQNLRDLSDVYIDDCNPVQDALLRLPGLSAGVGPLSGVGSFALVHLLELEAMEQCLATGAVPPVWHNANTPDGQAKNEALLKRYSNRVQGL